MTAPRMHPMTRLRRRAARIRVVAVTVAAVAGLVALAIAPTAPGWVLALALGVLAGSATMHGMATQFLSTIDLVAKRHAERRPTINLEDLL